MILWILATVLAFYIKGLCGFANTLVFTAVLGFGEANVNISPIELLLGYPTNLILTWRNRKQLDRKVYIPLSLLVLGGSIPGALAGIKSSQILDERIVKKLVIILLAISGIVLVGMNM